MTSIAMVLTTVERGNDRLFPELTLGLPPSLHLGFGLVCQTMPLLPPSLLPFFPFFLISHWPRVSDMIGKPLDGLLSGMERKLDSWLGSLSL